MRGMKTFLGCSLESDCEVSVVQFDYIIWTGDTPGHGIWNQSHSAQLLTLEYITKQLLRYFPDTPIFPALGNHESSPVNKWVIIGDMWVIMGDQ